MSAVVRRSIALACAPATGLAAVVAPGVRILMYHRVAQGTHYDQLAVSPARFDAHIACVARHARIVSLGEAVERLHAGALREPIVAITFDDGYLDNLTHALPVLERYGAPATIFVTTAFCDQQLRHPRYPDDGRRLHLDWDDVRALAARPGMTIGSHTRTHPYLRTLDDRAARLEIAQSRTEIEARIGRPVEFFCYPSGDMSAREAAMAREAGYRASVTVTPGPNRPGIDVHALRRTELTDRDDALDVRLKLAGAYDPMHAWLHRRRVARFARAAHAARVNAVPGESR